MTTPDDDNRWHLDRRVPVAIILTLAIQTGSFIWWAASLSERVNVLERGAAATAPQTERLTRVEVKVESVQTDVTEIKADIKRLIRRETP